tara:strand:- start:300 stop:770 length:471 start_codon:yes stop_codon:yes gene_type:complete
MPIVIEPKKKPPTRRKEKMAKSPKTKLAKAMELARKRKPAGRLNKDDIERAMKKRIGGMANKKPLSKRIPMSGGRDRKDSAYKMKQGLGTTAKSSTAEKSFALKKGTRPGQKSNVQKDKTRAAQRAGKRQDKFVGTARKMSGGRGRSYSGRKLQPK